LPGLKKYYPESNARKYSVSLKYIQQFKILTLLVYTNAVKTVASISVFGAKKIHRNAFAAEAP